MPTKPESPQKKFELLMRELFQMDMADLDFGIYRIFNMKRREIDAFLQKELPAKVDAAFASEAGLEVETIRAELAKTAGELRQNIAEDAVGADGTLKPEHAGTKLGKKYEEIRKQLAGVETTEEQKAEIFIHLVNFFSRYYDEADFIPRRFIGSGHKYMVPYNGEEVMLHWANRDQYYIKTGEYFRDYTFRLDGPGMLPFDFTVRFTMAKANTAKDNVKGKKRFFFPLGQEATADDKSLVIPFEYRLPDEKEEKKHDLGKSEGQLNILLSQFEMILKPLTDINIRNVLKKTQAGTTTDIPSEQLLIRRMLHFCRKNTSDYFIHKDLRGFLTSELEYYVKDQFIHIDDLAGDAAVQLRKLRVFRSIADGLVAFLSDIEELQKRLWLKKKLILGAHWCATLDRVPESLYPAICANEAQREEWVRLYGIDTFKKDGDDPGNTKPLKPAFLKAHPCMMVDTKFFDEAFKQTMLAAETIHTLDEESGERRGLDESTDGLLVHSENFQALRLLQERYREQVKCVYIDPPYNTGGDEFVYKDNYQHSSWNSMIVDRINISKQFCRKNGFFWGHIDYNESNNFKMLLDISFGAENFVNEIIWKRRGGSTNPSNQLGVVTDTIFLYKQSSEAILSPIFTRDSEEAKAYIRERFVEKDTDGRLYMKSPIVSPNYRENLCYDYKGYKHPPNGWSISIDLMKKWDEENKLYFPQKGERIYRKIYLDEYQGQPVQNLWLDIFVINPMANERVDFQTQKPVSLLKRVITISSEPDSVIMDFFAGSGTTAHAVINQNNEDHGFRKYLLIDFGDHFNTVLKPRIQKVVYADTWKEGKPVTPETGISHAFKYFALESYEDTLHNTLRAAPAGGGPGITAQVRYLLERASGVSLQLERFDHPFDCTIEVLSDDGPVLRPVDLVETFNYLYGIVVERYRYPVHDKDGTRLYRLVQGHTLQGKGVWVFWRDMAGLDTPKALEAERDFLEALAKEAPTGTTLLINADTAARGFQSLDGLFRTLMFSGSGE